MANMGGKQHQHKQAITPTRESNNANVRKTQPTEKSNAKKTTWKKQCKKRNLKMEYDFENQMEVL